VLSELFAEHSTKRAPAEGSFPGAETKAFLARRDFDLRGEQQNKTRTTSVFFARESLSGDA